MWVVDNQTPFAADRNWVRDVAGRHHWVVAVKATCEVGDRGELRLADEQIPPALEPVYSGEPGLSSLRWDSDLLQVKPTTDVVVEGRAHAAGGRPRSSMHVHLRAGPIDKTIVVHGPRRYRVGVAGLQLSSPEPFLSQAIRYEQAYGGPEDEHNPVGRGVARSNLTLHDTPAHVLEHPGVKLRRAGPAGLGAIDAAWLPRRAYAGTYGEAWAKSKKPLLPDDYDPRHACSAPADQQAPTPFEGGEFVELEGMSPVGTLAFMVPRVELRFRTYFGLRSEPHVGKLSSLILLPETRQAALVWQSTLMVGSEQIDHLDRTLVELEGEGLS